MESIKASIDIGTNSVLLLVCATDGQYFDVLSEEVRITRIGEGVSSTYLLKPEAIERTINVLKEYKDISLMYGAEAINVVATSAVRDAKNSEYFLKLVKDQLNLNVHIISGNREAELVYKSACSSANLLINKRILVIDIGGGSTELIAGRSGVIENVVSLQCGSVRMTEEYLKNDPPLSAEIAALKNDIKDRLLCIINQSDWKSDCCIGVAGTITTIAQMMLRMDEYKREFIEGYIIKDNELYKFIHDISIIPVEERKKITGLHPARADVILAGGIILEEIIKYFNFSYVITSARGLRYGILMN